MVLVVCLDIAAWLVALTALALSAAPPTPYLPFIKALPALIWGLSFLLVRNRGWALMAPALAAAAVGDELLASGGAVVFGVFAFAIMQLFYAVRFWSLARTRPHPRTGTFAAPLVYAVLAALLCLVCLPRLGALALPVIPYCLLLTAMASGSFAAGQGWRLAAGGALFFVSDSLILVFMAYPVSFNTDALILVPYYLSQGLIVWTLRGSKATREN